ncbi:hypothetical protein C0J08_02600 [Marinomonas sp. CT5]|uniref:helix-turn-helix domain-containing protein n=1 Tax=Marinomonas sp. CT5 TaxID=2066133 RepID=UPI001BB099AC|nr:helix-turn-helix domain-containing protein [Marinomonas sp. CT5]QUX94364.1 hypothetical protein C0J08_02600 [Marinomonas sp. CT5]
MHIQTPLTQSYTPFQPTLTAQGMSHFGLSVDMQRPILALSNSILAFLQVRVEQPTPYSMIPDGTNVLLFSPLRGWVGGTRLSILEVQLIEPGDYFGVWFAPGSLRQFFDVDLLEITQSLVGDDFLSHREFVYLSERLYEKETFSERVVLCESLFLKSLFQQPPPALSHALTLIYQSLGSISVTTLAQSVGLSRRHLNRLFSLHTGLSTKSFSQLIRSQSLLSCCYKKNVSIFHCGLDLGFYDQSHILRSLNQHDLSSLSLQTQQFMSAFYKPHQKERNILF